MRREFRFRPLTLLLLAWAACVACADSAPHPGVRVQLAWQSARLTPGHQTHVTKQRLACTQCHNLKGDAVDVASPTACVSCHQKASGIRHAEAQAKARFGAAAKADCTTCHAFAPSDGAGIPQAKAVSHSAFAPTDCLRCHSLAQGATPAVTVHVTAACASCHQPHEDATPQPGACGSCHQAVATTHAALHVTDIEKCTTCHQRQHAPASAASDTCATCHAKQEPLVPASALFAEGHRACVSCHEPHAFAKAETVSCRTCHSKIHVLGEASVQAHAQCTSCHSAHDARASPQKACGNCHARVHLQHPPARGQGACIGCHEPHPPAAAALTTTRACSSCHQTAHSDRDFHSGAACTQCHLPHDFSAAVPGPALCRSCHAQELARVALRTGHQACTGCHDGLPHRPASGEKACANCHASESGAVRSGHGQCANCHEPHSGAKVAGCGTCHAAEATSAPAGHSQCSNCHEPHTGSAVPGKACVSCHATEAKTPHAKLAGGCNTCHRAHGPQGLAVPPVCTTCHQVTGLSGLHQIPNHQACTNCHGGHGEQTNLARGACLSCHQDRKTHFAEARCASCHLFDTTRTGAPVQLVPTGP